MLQNPHIFKNISYFIPKATASLCLIGKKSRYFPSTTFLSPLFIKKHKISSITILFLTSLALKYVGKEEKNDVHFLPVCQDVRVRCLPCQRPKLHNCNKTAQIVNFLVLIFSMYHSRKVEQLGTLNMKKKEIKFQLNPWRYRTKVRPLTKQQG